ncbi:MAG: hypothetical protein ABI561_00960 [Bradyrhizobium sp.]
MLSITIDKRFCGPPNSGNGGYVCGMLANHIGASAEITLRAPPPLERRLDIVERDGAALELREGETILATGRPARIEISGIPAASYAEAEDAVRRTPFDENSHKFPTCFVCGPARASGDGLRIFAGPLSARTDPKIKTFAASWVPDANLADDDGRVATEFVWAALDCPTGYASFGALPPEPNGDQTILLGRMSARVDARPKPGDRCTVVAWPTGREGRKLFASSALLRADGGVLAVAQATWLLIDQHVQTGQK